MVHIIRIYYVCMRICINILMYVCVYILVQLTCMLLLGVYPLLLLLGICNSSLPLLFSQVMSFKYFITFYNLMLLLCCQVSVVLHLNTSTYTKHVPIVL